MSRVLLRHPHILTGDSDSPVVTGLLLEGESILAVGDAEALRAEAGRVVDLPGATVMPGLYDAHIHTANLARDLVSVDLRGARSLEEALDTLAVHVADLPQDSWVFGGRWDSNKWATRRQPDRHDLDRVAPGRKVALPSIDGHTTWASTAALEAAGITRDSADPVGGQVVRDADGVPTGILREQAAMPLRAIMADPTSTTLDDVLDAAQDALLSVGLTSVHDIDGEDCRAAYLRLRERGRLRLRVHKAVPVDALEGAVAEGRRTGDGDDWFGTGPVKLFSDGALGSRTAYLTAPYADDPSNRGMPVMGPEALDATVRLATANGIAVATHAIGDAAARTVLDTYEKVLADGDLPRMPNGLPLRLRVEHAQHLRPADVDRMARLGVVASLQPTHCTSDIALADELLAGHDIVSYAWSQLLRAGASVAFGSDAPVEEPNPFHGLYAAITRQRPDGTPAGGWQPEQRVSLGQAVAGFTTGAAYAAGQEGRKGRLSPGQLADLICIDRDPYAVTPAELRETQVLATYVGGECRWAAPNA
ncbi:amidohydrolase [Luteipulveratus sp. YIM 133132]|uniref:amidohydrolase n=1 Tax=Luteipulveratus flavus TaxID=3031728 RepID=UPI0023B19B89|nr:amidohydrolase [Luteipulveratus sp. YIM 133132]MDE9367526.1 amidohydrolase [Luteipulveratus sp. YIM 133132]